MVKNEQNIIQQLSLGDENLLEELYIEYYNVFLYYFKRYSVSQQDIEEAYQDSMIAFYQSILSGKLKNLKSSIKAYIFGIGKHKILDKIRYNKKQKDIQYPQDNIDPIPVESEEFTIEQQLLHQHFKRLGESCQRILKFFYYRGLSIKDIVAAGSYKDENTVKSHKSRCLKQLRSMKNENAWTRKN